MKDEHDFEEIKPLQKKLLEILNYFDAFCREHGIEYYIHSGTILGAIRHKGFIPWDDDVDVILTQDNYDKFVKLYREFGDEKKYHLQIFFESTQESVFAKLRANNTTFIEENVKHKKIHHGVFIDIVTLQTAPDGKYQRYWQYLMGKFIVVQEYAYKKNPPRGVKWIDRTICVLSKLPRFFCTRMALRQLKKHEGEKTTHYSRFTDGGMWMHLGLIKKTTMGKAKDIIFENLLVMGPEHPEEFLELAYGDWRKIPDIKQIKEKQHYCFFDVNNDFRKYLDVEELSDEKYL